MASAPEELSRVPCTRKTMSPRASLQTVGQGRGESATGAETSPAGPCSGPTVPVRSLMEISAPGVLPRSGRRMNV